jgi:hypothetical protein
MIDGITASNIDASSLLFPIDENCNTGIRTYLPATDRTILAWWKSPWDGRPGVNNAFIVAGKRTVETCIEIFHLDFPELASIWKMTATSNPIFFHVDIKKRIPGEP